MLVVDSRWDPPAQAPKEQDAKNNRWQRPLQLGRLKQRPRLPQEGAGAVLLTFPLLDFSTSWAPKSPVHILASSSSP